MGRSPWVRWRSPGMKESWTALMQCGGQFQTRQWDPMTFYLQRISVTCGNLSTHELLQSNLPVPWNWSICSPVRCYFNSSKIDKSNGALQYYTFFDLISYIFDLSRTSLIVAGTELLSQYSKLISLVFKHLLHCFDVVYAVIFMTISKWDWNHICDHFCFPTGNDIQLDSNLSTQQEVRSATPSSHLEPEDLVENCWPNRAKISKLETQTFAPSSQCCNVATHVFQQALIVDIHSFEKVEPESGSTTLSQLEPEDEKTENSVEHRKSSHNPNIDPLAISTMPTIPTLCQQVSPCQRALIKQHHPETLIPNRNIFIN